MHRTRETHTYKQDKNSRTENTDKEKTHDLRQIWTDNVNKMQQEDKEKYIPMGGDTEEHKGE